MDTTGRLRESGPAHGAADIDASDDLSIVTDEVVVDPPTRREIRLRHWLVMFVAVQAAALGLLHLANAVPDDTVLDRAQSGFDDGYISEQWPQDGLSGTPQDFFGECFLLAAGYDDGSRGTLEVITGAPNFEGCGPLSSALEARSQGESIEAEPHFRYWHGLSIVSRTWALVGGVSSLRVLSAMLLLGALAMLANEARKVAGPLGAAGILLPLLATGDLIGLVSVFHHPLMLAVGILSIATLIRAAAKGWPPAQLAFAAFLLGAVYNYVDLFNFVPGVWLVATGAVVIAAPPAHSLADRVRAGVRVGVGWMAGYVLMWLNVWVWAAAATSPAQIWNDVAFKVQFRVAGSEEFPSGGFGAGFLSNLEFWSDRPFARAVIFLVALVAVFAVWSMRRERQALYCAAVAVAPGLLVIPWMLASGQHHINHSWFEFRSFPMLVGLGLFALAAAKTGRLSARRAHSRTIDLRLAEVRATAD